jgi:hypothetical protein
MKTFLVFASLVMLVGTTATATAWTEQECKSNALTGYHYVLKGVEYNRLSDAKSHLMAGDEITVVFNVSPDCGNRELSFVSYNATSDFNLKDQTVFDSDTGTFHGADNHMAIKTPPCWWQMDFVMGGVIQKFSPPEGTYHAQKRFIDGTTGGRSCDTPTPTPTETSSSPGPCDETGDHNGDHQNADDECDKCDEKAGHDDNNKCEEKCDDKDDQKEETGDHNGDHENSDQTGDNDNETCATPTPTPTTPIPVFPSTTALGLGLVGAIGGVALVLRRRPGAK